MVRVLVVCCLLLLASQAGAQALNQFKPSTTPEQRRFIRAGIAACLEKIGQRTQGANLNVFGPCANEKGEWSGISRSGPLILTFSVNDDLMAGGIWNTILGKEVVVSCQYQVGMITGFEDRKSGVGDLMALNGLCMPAGTDSSERNR